MRRHACVLLLTLAVAALSATAASAEPKFLSKHYPRCTSCHYSPTGGGLLTGKYGRDRRPERGRLVDVAMYRTRYADVSNYELAERFSEHARERGLDPVALAIAWVASHPAVTAPIVGARDTEQLARCLAALDLQLDATARAELDALSPAPPPATDRNEERSANNYGSR